MDDGKGLFRKEALDNQRESWMGNILLTRPLPFTGMAWFFAVLALIAVVFVWQGQYTKKSRASGYVVPDQGLLKVYPQAPGFVVTLKVKEGQKVKEGDVLAIVTTERTGVQGNTQAEIAKQIARRRASLGEQAEKTQVMYDGLIEATRKRLDQTNMERQELLAGISGLRQRVANADKVVARYKSLEKEGYVAELMVNEKESDRLDQMNRLTEMLTRLSSNERDATTLRSDLASLPIKATNELATIERAISDLDTTGTENEARRESFVVAPQTGVVTQLQAEKGKQVSPAMPLMNIIPAGSKLIVSLYVPSRSRGFIRPGSTVQMQYQAFPYQKFGTQAGKVVDISRTSVPPSELPFPVPNGAPDSTYYVVTVQPDKDYVLAYGIKESLQSGMQLDADIWLETRTIFEHLLEPLYSITGRV